MKVISPRIHGYFDFLTVVIFLLAPALLGLSQLPAMLAYSLAAVHLIVTLTSDFPFGIFRLIPFAIHGWIERLVGPSLIALPFIFGFANEGGVVQYKDAYRLCYIRGPEGLLIGLAQELS